MEMNESFIGKMKVINTYYLCVGRQHCPPVGVPNMDPSFPVNNCTT